MSLDGIKMNKVKTEENLEQNLQNIVNDLTTAMEFLNFDSKLFEKFEDIFKNANTLEEIISAISSMIKNFVKNIKLLNLKQMTKSSSFLDETMEKKVSESNYQNLEKVLQKYEAEIREHIRIEQQLKIYTESLEEKIENFKKRKLMKKDSFNSINEMNRKLKKNNDKLRYEKKDLENKINTILKRKGSFFERLKNNSNENKDLKKKLIKQNPKKLFEKTKYSVNKKNRKDQSQKNSLRNNDFLLNFKRCYKDSIKNKSNRKNKFKNRINSHSQKILK